MDDRAAIILGIRLSQNEDGVSIAFYCNIPRIKEGYMYMFLGPVSQEKALWKGLVTVLKPLLRYRQLPITLGFSKLLLELGGDSSKDKCLSYLNSFGSIEYGSSDEYEVELEKVIRYFKFEGAAINELKGISKEELSKCKPSKTTPKNKVTKSQRVYYEEFGMPESGVVLDFECTSNIIDYARFIQVSALKFKEGKVVDQYTSFINPGITIPKKIRELTGITKEHVENAPNSFEAIKKLNQFLKGEKVVVGHNIEFDYSLLEVFCKRFNIPLWKGSLLCTRRLAKNSQVITDDYRLETLCDVFDIVNERPHQADSDVRATYSLMKSLYQTDLLSLI